MPRITDPRLNQQSESLPSDYAENFELPLCVQACLPIDLDAEKRRQVLTDIRFAVGEYYWEVNQRPHRYRRAEATAALRFLLKKNDFNRSVLSTLNQRAYDYLYFAASDVVQCWMLKFDDQEPPAEDLRAAAQRAIDVLQEQKGPEVSIPLQFLVDRLCHVYEEMTGLRVTHSNKAKDLGYEAESQSKAGQFVTCIVRNCYSEVVPSRISDCLRAFVQSRPEPL